MADVNFLRIDLKGVRVDRREKGVEPLQIALLIHNATHQCCFGQAGRDEIRILWLEVGITVFVFLKQADRVGVDGGFQRCVL